MAISLDAAKRLAAWKDQSAEQWLKVANRYLPPAVATVLVLAIAYRLAELTWLVVPSTPPDSPPPPVAVPRSVAPGPGAETTLASLANWHPFGEPAAVTAEPIVPTLDAPDTTLALILASVHAFPSPTDGYAGISSGRGEQKLYHAGAVIDSANGATLHSVYADRVLIDRGGRIETLRFPEPQELGGRAAPPTARLAPPPDSTASLREVISANASRITDIIRAAPHIEGEQMIGYRVTPARNREAFAALGLEPGDILTEVNGTALNDPASSLQVFESLGEASMATVTILRGGSPQVVVIDMTQLQNIAENLQ
jgi:general secretion pathway protein C